jgi:hypothetical protein
MKRLFCLLYLATVIIGCEKNSENETEKTFVESFAGLKHVSTTNLSAPRHFPHATSFGNKVYFSPGSTASLNGIGLDVVDVYDTLNKTWSILKAPKNMMNPYITSYGSKLILAGGFSGNTLHNSLEVYDTLTQKWTIYRYQYQHMGGGMTTTGKYIFFAGGQTFGTSFEHDLVEVFDMERLAFLPELKLSNRRKSPYAYSIKNKAYFMFGWMGTLGGKDYTRMDVYNTTNNSWDTVNIYRPNSQQNWTYNKYGIIASNTIAFTTSSIDPPSTDSIHFYNVQTNTWSGMKNFAPNSREEILVAGNLMIIAGGLKADGDISYENVNVYDLKRKTWQSLRLSHPRNGIELYRSGNKIFIAGGSEKYVLSNVVDIFELIQ